MTDESERRTQALTADSIEQLRDAISGVERLSDEPVDVADARVTLDLSPADADRLDALVTALGASVSVEEADAESGGDAEPVTAAGDGGAAPVDQPMTGGPGGPAKQPHPSIGEIQEPDDDPDLPSHGSIMYAVLSLLASERAVDGYDNSKWCKTADLADHEHNPYTANQTQRAISSLFHQRGAIRRRRIDDGRGVTYEYRAVEEVKEHVRDNGRFPWPDDAEVPDPLPPYGTRPYYVAEEGEGPHTPDADHDG